MTKVDPVLEAIGGNGRYQVLQFFLSMLAGCSASWQLLNIVFVGRNVPHECKKPENILDLYNATKSGLFSPNNSDISYEKCSIHLTTNSTGTTHTTDHSCLYGYQYTDHKDSSIMSDFDIVCDDAALRSLGQTLLILGQAIGALTLTRVSDRFGRRKVMVASHAIFLCLGVAISFVPDYTVYLVMRVILGISQQGIVLAYSTINIEVFSTRYRKIAGVLSSVIWSCAVSCIPLVAYLMRGYSWRYMQLAYCSVSLYVIIQFFFLDETLPWLITNRKVAEVERILVKASRMSGKDPAAALEAYKKYQESEEVVIEGPGTEKSEKVPNGNTPNSTKTGDSKSKAKDPLKPSFIGLMKRKRLAITVFILWFTWLTDSMTYFGLFMTAHTLVGDRFINVFLLSIIEAPSVLIFYFMVDRYGRKKTSMTLHCIAGLGLIAATIFQTLEHQLEWATTAVTVFYCMGMLGISGAWGCSFFFTPEMFPTNLRNFGLGTSSAFSRIGGMIAPFSSLLVDYVPWAPGAIFGTCCMLVTFFVMFLPETQGRPLPQTLDDMSSWYKETPTDGFNKSKSEKMNENIKLKEMSVVGLSYVKE